MPLTNSNIPTVFEEAHRSALTGLNPSFAYPQLGPLSVGGGNSYYFPSNTVSGLLLGDFSPRGPPVLRSSVESLPDPDAVATYDGIPQATRYMLSVEEQRFPPVKFTKISPETRLTLGGIEAVCRDYPGLIKTSPESSEGYELDSTGVPCWYDQCREDDTYLVEFVCYGELFDVAASCRSHVASIHCRPGRRRQVWLRNCSDCENDDERRVSHAVTHITDKEGILQAVKCAAHSSK